MATSWVIFRCYQNFDSSFSQMDSLLGWRTILTVTTPLAFALKQLINQKRKSTIDICNVLFRLRLASSSHSILSIVPNEANYVMASMHCSNPHPSKILTPSKQY